MLLHVLHRHLSPKVIISYVKHVGRCPQDFTPRALRLTQNKGKKRKMQKEEEEREISSQFSFSSMEGGGEGI